MLRYYQNNKGPTIGISTSSGVEILILDGLYFKDHNQSRQLEPFKDWRLDPLSRAQDLAAKLSIEQIAGLMIYSPHQAIPAQRRGFFSSTYNNKPFEESGANPYDLSDQQKAFMKEEGVRHFLLTSVESPEIAAKWNNEAQAFAEALPMGIPLNTSSDPRHGIDASKEFNEGAGGAISMWPEPLGLAASFDPTLVERFGQIAAKEYRALGITTALSPQIDLATEPRWFRFNGTFGQSIALSTDLARAYIDGFQTSYGEREIADGWGLDSVNAMVKHWPGGGTGEAGRDAHYGAGKYAVYPGGRFADHLIPFTQGAFALRGKTGKASAVMPYYTISVDQDPVNGENVGNSYNRYLIQELLRTTYQYDGVVCTDWSITRDFSGKMDFFIDGKPWGVEHLNVAQRHYKLLMAGVDQFGGNNQIAPILEAYQLGVEEHGESWMRKRMEASATRLLLNFFRLGLFENPYLDPAQSASLVGHPDFMAAGFNAQLRSIVMVKNHHAILPLPSTTVVYVPERFYPAKKDWFGNLSTPKTEYPINLDLVSRYFTITNDPAKADVALIAIDSPQSGIGYDTDEVKQGGNGYVPISLQYRPYTATHARENSLAGDDRSYRNKTVHTINASDLDLVLETKQRMGDKPVIVSILTDRPFVIGELEPYTDAILLHFGVQDQALLMMLAGLAEPSGLLPFRMPNDMDTVEAHHEDVADDITPYMDQDGHTYDFAFGLSQQGPIDDERTTTYGNLSLHTAFIKDV